MILLPLFLTPAAATTFLVDGEVLADPGLVDFGEIHIRERAIQSTWLTVGFGSNVEIRAVEASEGFEAIVLTPPGTEFNSSTWQPVIHIHGPALELEIRLANRISGYHWGELLIDHNGYGCGTRVPLRAHVVSRQDSSDPDDRDGDGFTVADGDCDDDDGWAAPDRPEWCDGVDNDCDGARDEGCDREPELVGCPTAADARGCGTAPGPVGASWPLIALLARIRRRG